MIRNYGDFAKHYAVINPIIELAKKESEMSNRAMTNQVTHIHRFEGVGSISTAPNVQISDNVTVTYSNASTAANTNSTGLSSAIDP